VAHTSLLLLFQILNGRGTPAAIPPILRLTLIQSTLKVLHILQGGLATTGTLMAAPDPTLPIPPLPTTPVAPCLVRKVFSARVVRVQTREYLPSCNPIGLPITLSPLSNVPPANVPVSLLPYPPILAVHLKHSLRKRQLRSRCSRGFPAFRYYTAPFLRTSLIPSETLFTLTTGQDSYLARYSSGTCGSTRTSCSFHHSLATS